MSETIEIDALTREIEQAAHDLPEIDAVYLFGSALEGRMRPDSDVDIGILVDNDVETLRRLDLRTTLASRLEPAVGRRVQVVSLKEADPILAFHIVSGRLLLDRDPVRRSLETVRIVNRYEDRRYVLDHFYRPALVDRIREGRFGRP